MVALEDIIAYLQPMLYSLPPLFMTITIHELAHGFTAYRLGDPTAKREGRLTLNPLKHLDPVGFLSMLIVRFGWAKPVPYNPLYFKNIRQGTFLVALAGPLSNILLAFIALLILANISFDYNYGYLFLELLFIYNITFAVFNSLPIPPLDGSKIFASILPKSLGNLFYKFERYGYAVLLILLFTNVLSKILNPIVNFVMGAMLYIVGLM